MMSLRILLPEGTTNYISNPSLRYDTTDWNAQGAAISRTLTRARFGIASLQVVTSGAAIHEGAYLRVSSLTGVNEPITVSAYLRGEGLIRIRLDDNAPGGNEYPSQPVQLNDERWTRISVTGRSSGGDDLRLYVETDEGAAVVRTFYLDGAQLERKPYVTTYCDGEQDNCRWNGIYHASTSTRIEKTRDGGQWVTLTGSERELEDLYFTVAGGLGMAPQTTHTQPFALAPGGYFQNRKVDMRVITFTFHAKHEIDGTYKPVSLEHLHELRQMLIDTIKSDLTGDDENIWFSYRDGPVELYFRARYEGGLEGEWDIRNQFVNSFPLRLLAVDPFFVEDSWECAVLDYQDTVSIGTIAQRLNGKWDNMNYGFDSYLAAYSSLTLGPRGRIYAGFNQSVTMANNNAAAVDPLRPVSGIASWDGISWSPLGAVGAGITVDDIAIAPNGNVYVTGSFTSIGGVAANRIAMWNGSAWSALGSGLNGQGYTLAISPTGDVYVTGAFTTAGGITCNIAKWDGSSWHAVVTSASGTLVAMTITKDGTKLYYGYSSGGLGVVYEHDVATATNTQLGSNFVTSSILSLRISPSGELYAGGTFYISTNKLDNGIARWNGSAWEAVGVTRLAGMNDANYVYANEVRDITFFPDGRILASGNFLTNGVPINTENMMIFNGSVWSRLDAQFRFTTGTDTIGSCLITANGDIVIGPSAPASSVICSGITTVTNPGTSESYPIIYIKGPGTVIWLENQTTKKIVYLYMELSDGEEVEIDFGKGTAESTTRGSLLFTVLAGSSFHDFTLIPGDNTIAAFMVDDVNASMQIGFQPRHWSVDATSDAEVL